MFNFLFFTIYFQTSILSEVEKINEFDDLIILSNARKLTVDVPIYGFGDSIVSNSMDIEKNFFSTLNFVDEILSEDLRIFKNITIEENLLIVNGVEIGDKNKGNGLFCKIDKEGMLIESNAKKGILLGLSTIGAKDEKENFQGTSY